MNTETSYEQQAPDTRMSKRLQEIIGKHAQYIQPVTMLNPDRDKFGEKTTVTSRQALLVFSGESTPLQPNEPPFPYEFVGATLTRLEDGRVAIQLEAFKKNIDGVATPEEAESVIFSLHTSYDDEGLVITEQVDAGSIKARVTAKEQRLQNLRDGLDKLQAEGKDTTFQEKEIDAIQQEIARLELGVGDTRKLPEAEEQRLLTDIENAEIADNGINAISVSELGEGVLTIWDNPPDGRDLVNGAPEQKIYN